MNKSKEHDKEYLEREGIIKEKAFKYMNYGSGVFTIVEVINNYRRIGSLFCWEMSVWYAYYIWICFGIKLSLKYLSFNTTAFIGSMIYHINICGELYNKQAYITVLITFLMHFNLIVFFRDVQKLVYIDFGVIIGCLLLTFHHMFTHLFDANGNCLWRYETAYADVSDGLSRVGILIIVICLTNYLNTNKIRCLGNLAQQIEEKSKEKERFFACVSHELRNPLNSLLASVEILPKTPASKQGELVSSAKSCGETLLHLIGNILDVSKIKDKKMELFFQDADITEIINKVMMMHSIKARNKGLYFQLKGDKAIPPCVKVDPAKVIQVLTNLISNSIKFTEKGIVLTALTWYPITNKNFSNIDFERIIQRELKSSNRRKVLNSVDENVEDSGNLFSNMNAPIHTKITEYRGRKSSSVLDGIVPRDNSPGPKLKYGVGLTAIAKPKQRPFRSISNKEQGVLKIEIIDSGIGISSENIDILFRPFAQADNSISQKYGGTGLGLWISKNITEIMGGQIKIESKLENGSNFMILLPLISGDEEKALKDEDMDLELQGEYSGVKILYVEDICENQMVMRQMLEQLGFITETASDGSEGLHLYKTRGIGYYDIILTDLRMPNMSGQTMIMEIRQYEQMNRLEQPLIPIMVLTGDPSENERDKCLNILKANAFLIKPISMLAFNRELRRIMRREDQKEGGDCITERKKLVLVIEDDKLLSNLMKMFLTDFDIIQAYSVKEGLEKFQDSYLRINAVCLDGNLEDGVGSDFLQAARDFEKKVLKITGKHVKKVISTSGDSVEIQEEKYKNLSVQKYLEKPFSRDQLVSALHTLVTLPDE